MIETDLAFYLGCCAFVGGFCFGAAFMKWLFKDVLRKYESVFGKINNTMFERF